MAGHVRRDGYTLCISHTNPISSLGFNRLNEVVVVANYLPPTDDFHSSMTGIVILPAGRDDAFEDYKQFIRDGHPIEDIESNLNI